MSVVKWVSKTDISHIDLNPDSETTFALLSNKIDKKWEGKILPMKKIIELRNTYKSNILIKFDKDTVGRGPKPSFNMSANGPMAMTLDEHYGMTLAIREAIKVYEQLF